MQHEGSEGQRAPDRVVDPVDGRPAGAAAATRAALPRRAPLPIGRKPPVGLERVAERPAHPAAASEAAPAATATSGASSASGEPSLFARPSSPFTAPSQAGRWDAARPAGANPAGTNPAGGASSPFDPAHPPRPAQWPTPGAPGLDRGPQPPGRPRPGLWRRLGVAPIALVAAAAFVALATVAGFLIGTLLDGGYTARSEVALFGVQDAGDRRSAVQVALSDEVLGAAAERSGVSLRFAHDRVAVTTRPAVRADQVTRGPLTGSPAAILVVEVDDESDVTAADLATAVGDAYVETATSAARQAARDQALRAVEESRRQLDEATVAFQAADDDLRRRLAGVPLEERLEISNSSVEALRAEVERITGELSGLQAEVAAPTLGADQLRATAAGPPVVQEGSGTMTPARSAAVALLAAIVLAGLVLTVASSRDENGPHPG